MKGTERAAKSECVSPLSWIHYTLCAHNTYLYTQYIPILDHQPPKIWLFPTGSEWLRYGLQKDTHSTYVHHTPRPPHHTSALRCQRLLPLALTGQRGSRDQCPSGGGRDVCLVAVVGGGRWTGLAALFGRERVGVSRKRESIGILRIMIGMIWMIEEY